MSQAQSAEEIRRHLNEMYPDLVSVVTTHLSGGVDRHHAVSLLVQPLQINT